MRFKLGLFVGAAAGYLVGSGKGAQMVSDLRARSASGGSGQSVSSSDSLLDFSDRTSGQSGQGISETFRATDAPMGTDI